MKSCTPHPKEGFRVLGLDSIDTFLLCSVHTMTLSAWILTRKRQTQQRHNEAADTAARMQKEQV